jgi:hypothetical protein
MLAFLRALAFVLPVTRMKRIAKQAAGD